VPVFETVRIKYDTVKTKKTSTEHMLSFKLTTIVGGMLVIATLILLREEDQVAVQIYSRVGSSVSVVALHLFKQIQFPKNTSKTKLSSLVEAADFYSCDTVEVIQINQSY